MKNQNKLLKKQELLQNNTVCLPDGRDQKFNKTLSWSGFDGHFRGKYILFNKYIE